jgi:hypothetical protein
MFENASPHWICHANQVFFGALAPKIVDPTRTLVLPTSIACSKSLDIPILSSRSFKVRLKASQTRCLVARRHWKSGLGPEARSWLNAPIVISPVSCRKVKIRYVIPLNFSVPPPKKPRNLEKPLSLKF